MPTATLKGRAVFKRAPWGHVSRHCVYCGKVGPRVVVLGGFAHRYCVPKEPRRATKNARHKRNDLG